MIKPNIRLSDHMQVNYYSLVVAVAKRAREIAAEAERKGEILLEKPVDLAVKEYIEGAFKIVEPEECACTDRDLLQGGASAEHAAL